MALALAPVLGVGGWVATYPDSGDPKNVQYVFWKWGIVHIDLDRATDVMIGDPSRGSLVIGRSEGELKARFGYLRPLSDANSYLKYCYFNSPWSRNGKTAMSLRNSNWMVLFENGKATDLVLAKGC